MPDSEPMQLSQYFGTRDTDTIIAGMGTLLAIQARRAELGMQRESENNDKLDPEVTKILNGVFDRGAKLAELINPALRKPTLQINNNTLNASSPQALMASVLDELEKNGIPRDQVTQEMIQAVLTGKEDYKQRALEVGSAERAVS